MIILVANLGSTSFKYRLFDMSDQRQLARGGVERIGNPPSRCYADIGGKRYEKMADVPDHAVALCECLEQLADPETGCLQDPAQVAAIGLKAVHGGVITGVQRVDDHVLAAMEAMNTVAPAHNPPYIHAMRLLRQRFPAMPLVAAFETDFHRTIPDRLRYYAIPRQWSQQLPIRRFGFHGASHRYIAGRVAELLGRADLRIISCHLGGSSSLCGIRNGQSVATSMGMSPQSGIAQNNRVGDFDPFALPLIMQHAGKSLDDVLAALASQGGLLGLSGVSGDLRDLEHAAQAGDAAARLALEVYISDIRRYLGAMLVELGGTDVLVFTGGIGENSGHIRWAVCRDLHELGIVLDETANQTAAGEQPIHAADSRARIWIVPTNEELIVARQTKELLES